MNLQLFLGIFQNPLNIASSFHSVRVNIEITSPVRLRCKQVYLSYIFVKIAGLSKPPFCKTLKIQMYATCMCTIRCRMAKKICYICKYPSPPPFPFLSLSFSVYQLRNRLLGCFTFLFVEKTSYLTSKSVTFSSQRKCFSRYGYENFQHHKDTKGLIPDAGFKNSSISFQEPQRSRAENFPKSIRVCVESNHFRRFVIIWHTLIFPSCICLEICDYFYRLLQSSTFNKPTYV